MIVIPSKCDVLANMHKMGGKVSFGTEIFYAIDHFLKRLNGVVYCCVLLKQRSFRKV